MLGISVEPRLGVPAGLKGTACGVLPIKGGPTTGVQAIKGELTGGTPGNLAVDWGKTDARGVTMVGLAPLGATNDLVLTGVVVGTCGAGLEMIRTWLPGPKPWGGTTKRALFRKICVPAVRCVDVLMITLC